MEEVKAQCVGLINCNAQLVVNASSWKRLADAYPELVMHIFRKKN